MDFRWCSGELGDFSDRIYIYISAYLTIFSKKCVFDIINVSRRHVFECVCHILFKP